MNGERERILKLLEEGRITSDEAYKLLKKVEKDSAAGRVLRIKVKEHGKEKVNIRVPLSVARSLLKFGGKMMKTFSPETRQKLDEHDIDIEEIIDALGTEFKKEEGIYKIVEVEEEDERVSIWIE